MTLFCVLVNREGNICDIFESTALAIYEKKATWECLNCKKLKGFYPKTPAEVRRYSEYLAKTLSEIPSNILIGTSITGVPYYILDKNGIILCEANESNEVVLNAIYEDFCVQPKEKAADNEMIPDTKIAKRPYIIDSEGTYYFDFIQAQKEQPDLTTKKVLLPFFEETIFHTLLIKASHMIPWIFAFAEKNHYTVQELHENNVCILKIEPRTCEEKMEETRCKV